MSRHYIQLQEANCRNCLRCVRVCPTKAMTYVDHQPKIIEEECVLCGQCYLVCPHSAKKVNSDEAKIKQWLKAKEEVVLSVAPSFAAIWPNYEKLKAELIQLGFKRIEETAKGAKIVSQAYTDLLSEKKMKNIISTCCPAVVALVEKEFPELVDQLAPVVSPMIAHGLAIKKESPEAKVVFVTPCIAKQKEINDPRFANIIDATISMPDLANWLSQEIIEPVAEKQWQDFDGKITRLYPTPGGVLKTLSRDITDYKLVNAEGIGRVKKTLQAIRDGQLEGYFFEMSSCQESCLGGPLLSHFNHNEWLAQSLIRSNVDVNDKIKSGPLPVNVEAKWQNQGIVRPQFSEAQIQDMLWMMQKTNKSKELDCGCCGYETCRDKAIAVLEGKADPRLCLPMALENAESLSNLIIENTPNGIIVLNKEKNIREMNPSAQHMLNLDSVNPKGLPILSILPSKEMDKCLNTQQKVQYFRMEYPQYNMIIEHAIISLEEIYIIILMDLTVEETKEKVIKSMQQQTVEVAQKVIDDQMRAVQEIASLLGETTAKSKVALTQLMKAISEDE